MTDVSQKPFLTIGIPTWNRCEPLRANLLAIIDELRTIGNEAVEILISDNASTDGTEALCRSLAYSHAYINYRRNETNLGANANFYNVLKSANGRYVWLLGDDDMVVEGSIPKLISDIRGFHLPEIVIGGCVDESFRRVYLRDIGETVVLQDEVFDRYSAIAVGGKISVLVFSKEKLDQVLEHGWSTIEELRTGWPHLVWLILTMNAGGRMLILSYGTNYMLAESRYNLLYDGVTLARLHINDYFLCIRSLEKHLNLSLSRRLYRGIIATRAVEVFRYAVYATMLNGYTETVSYAWKTAKLLRGTNRLYFVALYLVPVLVPIFMRKAALQAIAVVCFRCRSYKEFLNRLIEMRRRLNIEKENRQQRRFSVDDL